MEGKRTSVTVSACLGEDLGEGSFQKEAKLTEKASEHELDLNKE